MTGILKTLPADYQLELNLSKENTARSDTHDSKNPLISLKLSDLAKEKLQLLQPKITTFNVDNASRYLPEVSPDDFSPVANTTREKSYACLQGTDVQEAKEILRLLSPKMKIRSILSGSSITAELCFYRVNLVHDRDDIIISPPEFY